MFTDLVYSPKFKYQVRIQFSILTPPCLTSRVFGQCLLLPGDFVLYDNHRMLHARTGFKVADLPALAG